MRWRRRTTRVLPADADQLLARHVGEWRWLTDPDRTELRELTAEVLSRSSWEPARGLLLTDSMCAVIAAQAATVALGLDPATRDDLFHRLGTFIVHRAAITGNGPRPGPISGTMTDGPYHLDGEAHHRRGPVVLAWNAVRRETANHGNGRNVVVHEVAHKLDMLDGVVDGTPPIAEAVAHDRWVEVCADEYERLVAADGERDPVLRDYATTDPGEFFAVAAEVFFDAPAALATHKPALYGVLRDAFGQDPAARRSG